MKIIVALLFSMAVSAGWKEFCERHLIADDPQQYAELTLDQLIDVGLTFKNAGKTSKVFDREVRKRLAGQLSHEDRERLKVLR